MLSVLLWALAAVGLAVLVALVAVVALPVSLAVTGQWGAERRLRVELGLFGGLVPRLGVVDSDRPRRPAPAEPVPPGRTRKRRGRRRRGKGPPVGRMIAAAPELLGGLLHQIRVERFRLDAAVGLGDPADTGAAFGALAPVLYGAGWAAGPSVSVAVRPVFDRACLDGVFDAAVAVTPARLVPPALRFAWRVFGPGR